MKNVKKSFKMLKNTYLNNFLLFFYKQISNIIIIKNPITKKQEPSGNFLSERISGTSSSTMTYIIEPADKDKSQGIRLDMLEAKKKPAVAKSGSTSPLKTARRKDFFLLFKQLLSGKAVASPSGKFWIAIPTANISAESCEELVANAVPTAKPTDKPSGML